MVMKPHAIFFLHESCLKNLLETKLIVPEDYDVLSPWVQESVCLQFSIFYVMQKSAFEIIAEKCVPLGDLDLEPLKFNEEVYNCCEQFIIHLVHHRTGKEVSSEIISP